MENIIISIIVPVYNVERYIEKCVESIISQTFRNIEIIIVDDGATDRSGVIADQLATRDQRIRVIHKQNGGLSSARNEGVVYAKGKFLMFIDSDDYIASNMCEVLYKHAIDNSCDLVECGVIKVYVNHNRIEVPCAHKTVMTGRDATIAYLDRSKNIQSCVVLSLYNKEIFTDIRFEDGRLHEDGWFKYKALYNSKRVCLIPDALYYYVQEREGSIMTVNLKEKNVRDVFDAFYERWKYFERRQDSELAELSKVVYLNNLLSYHYSIGAMMKDKEVVKKLRKEIRDILKSYKNYIFSSPLLRKNLHKYLIYFYLYRVSTFISNKR